MAEPELDEFGLLRFRGRWVALSPHQEILLRRLLAAAGQVVSRQELAAALWPEHPDEDRTLDAHVSRLRKRVRPFGVTIHTIRARGFLLALNRTDNEGP